jgi:hypothetical protein
MCQISDGPVDSIKRVMSNENYILKKRKEGLKLLTINDLKSKEFSVKHLLDVKGFDNFTDSLQV